MEGSIQIEGHLRHFGVRFCLDCGLDKLVWNEEDAIWLTPDEDVKEVLEGLPIWKRYVKEEAVRDTLAELVLTHHNAELQDELLAEIEAAKKIGLPAGQFIRALIHRVDVALSSAKKHREEAVEN
jgi:hypothetical protein